MLREIGYCSGVENYSGIFEGRAPGETPHTLLDYFPEDFIMFIDESHATLPQVRGMSGGDRARKENLVLKGNNGKGFSIYQSTQSLSRALRNAVPA